MISHLPWGEFDCGKYIGGIVLGHDSFLLEVLDLFKYLARFFGWEREPFVSEGGFHGGEPGGHTAYLYLYVELPLVALKKIRGIERQVHIMQVM